MANSAGVVATNSVLVADRLPDSAICLPRLAAAALTGLAQLSAELEGHVLGGGALKLEPAEARRWVLPHDGPGGDALAVIDAALRAGDVEGASELADDVFLRRGLGLSPEEIGVLRSGVAYLQQRRLRAPASSPSAGRR